MSAEEVFTDADTDEINRIYDEMRAHWIVEALKRLATNPDYISLITNDTAPFEPLERINQKRKNELE